MQAVLDESAELLRAVDGTLICVTHHGFVCANAGVDQSNASGRRTSSCCCPRTRTRSAARLRAGIEAARGVRPGGRDRGLLRPRLAARADGRRDRRRGLVPLDQWIGRHDAFGRELRVTSIAVADSIAAPPTSRGRRTRSSR